VLDDQTRIVDYLYNTCRFFAHESCGQCTPCREGTTWFYKTIKRIRNGGGRLEDLDVMNQLAQNMGLTPGTTICGLADGAAWPVKNVMAKFRGELEEFIRTHQVPSRGVTVLQEDIYRGQSPAPWNTAMPEPGPRTPGPVLPAPAPLSGARHSARND
jgi:NADH-quinone oxidoreductase subunit F